MDKYPLDYAFGAALLTLLAVSAAVWIATTVKGWRRIRRSAWPTGQHASYFMPPRRWPLE